MYNVALFLHVVGVVTLVSGLALSLIGMARAQRATDVRALRAALGLSPLTERLIPPALALILLPGLYMASRHGGDGGIRWSSGWLDVAMGLFVVMAALGPTVEGRRIGALRLAAEEAPDGPLTAEIDAARRDPVLTHVGTLGACSIIAFLFLMTTKPALGGALATVLVAAAVSVVLGRLALRTVSVVAVSAPTPATPVVAPGLALAPETPAP